MIAQIEGQLIKLQTESCLVKVGAVSYEIMLASYCVEALSGRVGSEITLYTMEYYEGSLGGGNLIPRMIGFLNADEKDFFSKYISVKGMGIKKGLRSLNIPIASIATAIENGDEKVLLKLPAVGSRMAQQIIAELRGKLQDFALGAAEGSTEEAGFKPFQVEALEILIAWGEKRSEAIELIELARRKHPDVISAEELVPLVYRLKQGVEV
ncbi:MAG: OB-fold domain-containing protein [Sedimentisphaerales bacterium]